MVRNILSTAALSVTAACACVTPALAAETSKHQRSLLITCYERSELVQHLERFEETVVAVIPGRKPEYMIEFWNGATSSTIVETNMDTGFSCVMTYGANATLIFENNPVNGDDT